MTRGRSAWVVMAVGTALIAFATLRPIPGAPVPVQHWCIICGELGGVDFVLNVVLFMPLGVGLGLSRCRPWMAFLLVLGVTVTIELLQIHVISGRHSSLGDVVANSLGGVMAISVARHLDAVLHPLPGRAVRLAAASVAAWLALMVGTVWSFAPSVPTDLYGNQWQPTHYGYVPFFGRLLSLTMNGKPLPAAHYTLLYSGFAPLSRDSMRVDATVLPGPPVRGLSAIARLSHFEHEAFLVGRTGDDLVFRSRLRAADVRLRVPMIALRRAFPVYRGGDDTVRLTGRLVRGALIATADDGRTRTARSLPLTPGIGWALLLPWNVPLGWWAPLLSALWLLVLSAPVGYWLSMAMPRARWGEVMLVMLGLSMLGVGLGALPSLALASQAGGWEWAGSVLGLVAGRALAVLSRRSASTTSAGGHYS